MERMLGLDIRPSTEGGGGGEIGAAIGPYRLVRELGRGGMGVVYEAVHGASGQPVAIKIVRSSRASESEQAPRRLLREAHALSSVRHDGLVRLFGVGSLTDGTPYLVMELLGGETLRSRLERLGRL